MAAPFGIDNIITVDMGGTSFDITLARGGQTNPNRNIDFLRHRIGVPMITSRRWARAAARSPT